MQPETGVRETKKEKKNYLPQAKSNPRVLVSGQSHFQTHIRPLRDCLSGDYSKILIYTNLYASQDNVFHCIRRNKLNFDSNQIKCFDNTCTCVTVQYLI